MKCTHSSFEVVGGLDGFGLLFFTSKVRRLQCDSHLHFEPIWIRAYFRGMNKCFEVH